MARYASTLAGRRFATALIASALAHLFLSTAFIAGSARGIISRASPVSEPQQIVARLLLPEAAPTSTPPVAQPERMPRGRPNVTQENIAAASVANRETRTRPAHAGPAEIPDPTYYGARQLDVYPALLTALDLPNGAASDAKGHVLLLLLLDATGMVNEVSVVEADPPGRYDENALTVFRSARFSPALRDGRPVRSRLMIQVEYGPQDGGTR